MKKLFPIILVVFLLLACSREKNVKSEEFDLFKKEISSNEKISDIQIKFRRPSLFISIIVSENFKIDDLEEVIDELKLVINVNHMDEIANKYWGKDTKVSGVYVYFYNGKIDKSDTRKNLIYSIYTNYYKTHIVDKNPMNIDGYTRWFIDIDMEKYQLDTYLEGIRELEKLEK